MSEISPIEKERVPADIPEQVIFDVEKESKKTRKNYTETIFALEEGKKNIVADSPEKVASGITYLEICESFVSLPFKKERASKYPLEMREKKMKEFARSAAEMNQDFMFLIRHIRTQPNSNKLLEGVHETFRTFVRNNPKSSTMIENYDNWVGGIFMELATIEAIQDIMRRFRLGGKVIKSSPEDDAGLNDDGKKIDFFIEKQNGESTAFQLKTMSGVDENWTELETEQDFKLLSIFCRKREDIVDLTDGRFNVNLITLLAPRLIKTKINGGGIETSWI